ncbi:ferri-bacillibactin esterase [Fusarium beomiforme]|uniref:Ferri-bacillibactin esterase n=1 Tax=Fusarium beomiforme TaxID=44412 RepID=A0A9P5AJQ1_9HYPO|nr:ferri-bacillibactin esterase [Fusarium beomiforme]
MTLVPTTLESAHAHNSCQFLFPTRRGDYLIQVSWPLCWKDRAPLNHDLTTVSTVYIVDGNAYFFTATEIARRLEFTHQTRAVLVAVGYPNKTGVFDKRRNGDLTPASSDGVYDIPPGPDGKPPQGPFGGASDFLDIIKNHVQPYIENTLFPNAQLEAGPKALFGHSYGGLFTLNALFTKPDSFDTFIAASPSIWFNNCSIVHDQEHNFNERAPLTGRAPRLLVMFGGAEQTLIRLPGESDEKFDKKQKGAALRKMKDNALDLVARMEKSPHLRHVWCWEFEGEDHGCAAPCALQRGLLRFLIGQRAEQ